MFEWERLPNFTDHTKDDRHPNKDTTEDPERLCVVAGSFAELACTRCGGHAKAIRALVAHEPSIAHSALTRRCFAAWTTLNCQINFQVTPEH